MHIKGKEFSITAIVLTTIYLILLAGSTMVLLTAGDDDSLAGIFLVMLTPPWTFGLLFMVDVLHIESTLVNTLFLIAGGLINASVIYVVVSWIMRMIFGHKKKQA